LNLFYIGTISFLMTSLFRPQNLILTMSPPLITRWPQVS